jgi:uncharacterized SAM-binding protein YcdF (DUF218 family)
VAAAALLYVAVGVAQVVVMSRLDQRAPADAIIVLGAAQYDGRPSPVLSARLDHALTLYQQGLSPRIVVTGGKQVGDRFTEATASANYLIERGVPDQAILREVRGTTTWESLAEAAKILTDRGFGSAILVSDPYHSARIVGIATELGLEALASPTRTSPESTSSVVRHMVLETGGVSAARFIGFRRLLRLDPG